MITKELEAFRKNFYEGADNKYEFEENLSIIEKALKRLEAIDNANPNEALERVIEGAVYDHIYTKQDLEQDVNSIKQALLKAQEQEKVLEVIKKHFIIKLNEETELNGNVWCRLVMIQSKEDEGTWDTTACANLVDYKEEFKLLKRWLDE